MEFELQFHECRETKKYELEELVQLLFVFFFGHTLIGRSVV